MSCEPYIEFTKMHGLGNDFVLIDCRYAPDRDFALLARRLCHRTEGIGADGLLLLLDSEIADFRMRIFNSDGSEAQMCGNGIRCIGKYVFDNFGLDKKLIVGYDPRNMAFEFASQTAEQLANYGFNVLLSDKVIPTPVLAYNAKHLNACALMFTASHNPPEYLGIKFIPDYAGPATSDITDELMFNLNVPFNSEFKGHVEKYNFAPDYFAHIEKLIDIASPTPIILVAPSILGDNILRHPIFSTMFDETSIEKSKNLPEIYSQIAQHKGCKFLDLNTCTQPSEIDGLHYELKQHKIIAEKLHHLLLNP